ncbi:YybH family protein [Capilliphycus salinus ALCB114379]|uniref:YybH family protein n=1 Tax=Capilliphycus salinus TaxID=2768948 RepID=UPI0039A56AA0
MSNLSDEDLTAIQDIHEKWILAEKQGKSIDVLQYCTEDVRWMVPNSSILEGKKAASSLLNDTSSDIIDISLGEVEISGCGNIAYKICEYKTQFKLKSSEAIEEVSGTHLWILHKQENQQWKVALVTWQFSAPE